MLHKEINLFYLLWYHPRKDFQVGVWFLVFCPFEVGVYYFLSVTSLSLTL